RTHMTNAGVSTVEWLFREQLKVDAEWSIRTPNGFRWWADRNAQTVEVVGQEAGPDGELGYLISVQTELLRSLDIGERELAAINAILMPFASMAGPVYDQQTKTVILASLVTFRCEMGREQPAFPRADRPGSRPNAQ